MSSPDNSGSVQRAEKVFCHESRKGEGHRAQALPARASLANACSGARRSYELADGTEQELPIGFGVIEVEGLSAGATLVFAGEQEEPLLGVTVLESAGLWLDPQHERLIRRPPKRKAGNKKKKKRYIPSP